ncbi:MAG: hypothetical protein M1482_05200 [Chloroflexi bacterium]|nr:hypothetical protein [Chloroflexota bacterium]
MLHFLLDFILFRGNFFGGGAPSGPPPGAALGRAGPQAGGGGNPLLLALNELFLLNSVGYVVLVIVYWLASRWLGKWSWLVEFVLMVYAAAAIVAWLIMGRPNPMGLGFISKAVEVVLIVTLGSDLWVGSRSRQTAGATS